MNLYTQRQHPAPRLLHLHPLRARLDLALRADPLLLRLVVDTTLHRVHLVLGRALARELGLGRGHALAVLAVLVVRAEHEVPPTEGRRVVVRERHVMEVVVVGAGPEGQEVLQRPREVCVYFD